MAGRATGGIVNLTAAQEGRGDGILGQGAGARGGAGVTTCAVRIGGNLASMTDRAMDAGPGGSARDMAGIT